ncbi:purine-binding chemotaxis protein CheW [Paenibacillus nanensis]|uniref:Purine-binding chemotaxis protein CheW n=1 Tax=Paenibacillus nanensis TaxID=393251 RepID=A0A3A1UZI3_9BACL|nr:chemotaxis protein CheW [Paenibacillus nanensis]RIX53684.1 purine-binding chemotaxis protein CheW [Paenibacillus nanensis]
MTDQNGNQDSSGYDEDTMSGKYLTFQLGTEVYGIEIAYVIEIIGIQAITEVPELPEYIRGIINLRGKIIPVMDVRLRFRKTFRPYNDRTCIIVIDIQDVSIGLVVDSVSEVLSIAEHDVVPPPELGHGHSNRFIKGVGKVGQDVKLLLDCEKLLQHEVLEELSQL